LKPLGVMVNILITPCYNTLLLIGRLRLLCALLVFFVTSWWWSQIWPKHVGDNWCV